MVGSCQRARPTRRWEVGVVGAVAFYDGKGALGPGHAYIGARRTHVEVYLRDLAEQDPRPANSTLRRRISTLPSWFTWLEDDEINVGNPAARVRRPRRQSRPQPWLDRNELTDLLAAAETGGGYAYALVCLLRLNGLRVSEACSPDIGDLGGARYEPTLRIIGKGDNPAEIPRDLQGARLRRGDDE